MINLISFYGKEGADQGEEQHSTISYEQFLCMFTKFSGGTYTKKEPKPRKDDKSGNSPSGERHRVQHTLTIVSNPIGNSTPRILDSS